MTRLKIPLRGMLRDTAPQAMLDRTFAVVRSRRLRRSRVRRASAWGATVLAAAAMLLLFVGAWQRHTQGTSVVALVAPTALRLADGSPIAHELVAPIDAPRTLILSDGSRLVLGPAARLETRDNDRQAFALALVSGVVSLDVVHTDGRMWTIDAGLATVEVVGTAFEIDRGKRRLKVSVERGTVTVRGARVSGGMVRLQAGASVTIDDGGDAADAGHASVGNEPATVAVGDLAPSPSQASVRPGMRLTAWKTLAREGHFQAAFAELGPKQLRDEAVQTDDVETLWSLADVARLSGHPSEAVLPLERIVARSTLDSRASLAAFTLGKIELEDLHDARRAAESFDRCVQLSPPRGLAEDAYARRVEAWAKAGDTAARADAAAAYHARFPGGRYAQAVDAWRD